ncbi:hypothetical protein [Myxacorys almedinensis]|uniref:Uncharacterized protein n=1 Tax=Myxacorys almedinensis A TaxID=2690445 RepID=A0A8J8CLH5_9CYAN|nr:hypothetical protein [Myxacorys almedinensis]NDJ17765.1 hypothetical protein [Myxacorys almedinensis A]
MNYPIPATPEDLVDFRQEPVTEELVATAIVGVIQQAKAKGQSLEELMVEVLTDDCLLEGTQRRWLSELVAQTWVTLP